MNCTERVEHDPANWYTVDPQTRRSFTRKVCLKCGKWMGDTIFSTKTSDEVDERLVEYIGDPTRAAWDGKVG